MTSFVILWSAIAAGLAGVLGPFLRRRADAATPRQHRFDPRVPTTSACVSAPGTSARP